jgi:hypothetical protein
MGLFLLVTRQSYDPLNTMQERLCVANENRRGIARPRDLHACGHIHGAHGCDVLASGAIVVNASLVNERYEMTNAPILVQLGPFADRG